MMSTNAAAAPTPEAPPQAWYRGLTKYHWFVLLVCWCGWLFDTLAQQLFTISRAPALMELLGCAPTDPDLKYYSGIATMMMMFGWATGGIFFGYLGDRWGRAKTLVVSVLFYSLFTVASSFSTSWIDFSAYRFLTGLGVGGTFAAAVSLVAETLPARSRPYALGFLQALAALGNMVAALVSLSLQPSVPLWLDWSGWRWLFLVGGLPAVLVLFVMFRLKEPDAWVKAKEAERRGELRAGQKLGSMKELFGDPRWRRNVIVGFVLGLAGVVGLWSIGFWLPELVRETIPLPTAAGLAAANPGVDKTAIDGILAAAKTDQDTYVSWAMVLFNGAAAIGTYLFTLLMAAIGRRPSFALMFVLALASVLCVFGFMTHKEQVWWMAPILGLGTLTIFGGYSIYFPELFPSRLRASGVGFCYNTARYLAATFPFALGYLTKIYADWHPTILSSLGSIDSPFRYAAFTVATVFLLGLVVIPFGPETKGKPLPE
jgi:MFS family permease